MPVDIPEMDDQDQSEIFDEDNLDESETGGPGPEYRTFEETPDVLDVTRRQGDDRDDPEMDEADFQLEAETDEDLEEGLYEKGDDGDEAPDTDAYDETDLETPPNLDLLDGVTRPVRRDTPLQFVPDVEALKGAQGSAAHFESRRELDDQDLEELGYRDKQGGER
ncbi:MAG TPA: hypothetical protein VGL66_01120 [Caulobacteraceae bacterium]|jgi:hypothetical protein